MRSVAVERSPIAAWAMAHSAVSDAVTHGSSLTQRIPRCSIANSDQPSARRTLARSPVRQPDRTG